MRHKCKILLLDERIFNCNFAVYIFYQNLPISCDLISIFDLICIILMYVISASGCIYSIQVYIYLLRLYYCVAIVHNGIVYIGYWLGTGILYCARNSS